MTKKRTTKIEIETQEMLIVHQTGSVAPPSCPECGNKSMFTPEQLANLSGASQRPIFRWIESGIVHFCETAGGKLYVCLNSFPQPPNPRQPLELEAMNPPRPPG
jgi:hypothetical protein